MAKNYSDFILCINPMADFRHHALDFARVLRRNILPFRAVCHSIV